MRRAWAPMDNDAMEAINGWSKTETLMDLDLSRCKDVSSFVERRSPKNQNKCLQNVDYCAGRPIQLYDACEKRAKVFV